METRKSKRSLRLALVLGAAVAGSALVGWGGLAAWQAYTQNAGNAFSAGSVTHTNLVAGAGHTACTSGNATTTICDVIVTGANLDYSWLGVSNTVTITDTGSLPSTFELSTPTGDAPTGGLCSYLNLEVSDANNTYGDQAGVGTIGATTLDNASNAGSWAQGQANTFNFDVTPTAAFGAPESGAMGQSCSFAVLFTQAG